MMVIALLVGCIALLLIVLINQALHLRRLGRWLHDKTTPAQADGLAKLMSNWQSIFDELYRQEQNHQKRLTRLNHTIHRLNRMMTAIPSAVLIINKKGMIEWKNQLGEAYLSLKDDKLPLKEQIHDEAFLAFLDNVGDQEQTNIKLSLGQKTLLCTLIPIEADARMLICHDISATEQLYISKNNFIANVSHELRTPLTVIQGFLEALSDNDLDQALEREFVSLMQQESTRMAGLIEELLLLSHLENDELPSEQDLIDLSQMITDIVQSAKTLSDTHTITTDISPDIWVMGSHKELYSAFSNLIFNAIRHTNANTQVEVRLSCHEVVDFYVKDDGEGIAPEHLGHLTERFYRVDKGRSRKTGGSGLGLAIAKHALARHHATLTIDSTVGVGSTFGVRMPKHRPDTPANQ